MFFSSQDFFAYAFYILGMQLVECPLELDLGYPSAELAQAPGLRKYASHRASITSLRSKYLSQSVYCLVDRFHFENRVVKKAICLLI